MKDLQVKYTDPLDLIPYENNPRINDYAVKKVMESIKEYGFTNPIIVDADMVIIAGHTRREASILAGLDRVPYIVRDDLTPEQVKAYRIADNKLAELSNWDDELLKKELFELQAVDYSLEVMGFTEIDLKEIFTEKEVPKEKKKKEEKTTLPMLRFGSNSVRITEDELVMLSNRYNEYVESTPDEGFITWLLRLIAKTSYMDVLEKMLRKRGGKVVMSGVREMTSAEEIRNLVDLGVDQNVIDRMTQKYNKMLTDHGNTCNKIRDEVYREVRGVKAELAEKETIIRVLTTHIREKDLL